MTDNTNRTREGLEAFQGSHRQNLQGVLPLLKRSEAARSRNASRRRTARLRLSSWAHHESLGLELVADGGNVDSFPKLRMLQL